MITKRQLGVGMTLMALAAIGGLLALDFLGAGQFEGIGPSQQRALLAAGGVLLLGLSLLPLGDRPA